MRTKESDLYVMESPTENKFEFFRLHKKKICLALLLLILIVASVIRTSNIPAFQGKYLPDVDSYLFYRYVAEIHDHGSLPEIDTLRNYPLGFKTSDEYVFPAYVIIWLDKLVTIFNPSQTIYQTIVLYPVIFFALGIIAFFFLVRRLFGSKVALLSAAFLSVLPSYVYRTSAGVADKEPLGMLLMFLSLLFFVKAWQSETMRKAVVNMVLAGIFTGLMGLSWAGVAFVTLLIPVLVFVEYLLNKVKKKEMQLFAIWTFIHIFILASFAAKYWSQRMYAHFAYSASLVVLAIIFVDYMIFEKKLWKLDEKLTKFNRRFSSVAIAAVLGVILLALIFGPSFITSQAKTIIEEVILHPGGTTRFQLTVSENQQPYFNAWLGNFGKIFFWLFFIGSVVMFFDMVKGMKKYGWILTGEFALFIIGLVFSRYSSSSALNGTSSIARSFMVIPLLIMAYTFIHIYLQTSKHDTEAFSEFSKFDSSHIFVLILFTLMVFGARSSVRLLFTLSVPAAMTGAFMIFYIPKYLKSKELKIVGYSFLTILVYLILFNSALHATSTISKDIIFNSQWQSAMGWVQNNTAKDAVFASWWDYGYWIQMVGQRATVTDGGNAIGYWNHLLARHLLTGQSEDEALEFLKAHNVSYFLTLSDEIPKYAAFSSIGSDENNDRNSMIQGYLLDKKKTYETRNQTISVYSGNFPLDEDFLYNDTIMIAGQARIISFEVPFETNEAHLNTFNQPYGIILYKNVQYRVPLQCIYLDPTLNGIDNGRELGFQANGLNGCLRIVPSFTQNAEGIAANVMGGALYLSEKVRGTMFSQLYLLGKKFENFNLVYDPPGNQLGTYNGNLNGPLRIWAVSYPDRIKFNPEYLKTSYPNKNLYLIN